MSDEAKKRPWSKPQVTEIEITDEVLKQFGLGPDSVRQPPSKKKK